MSPLSLQYRLNKRLLTGMAALIVVFGATLGTVLVRELSLEFDRSLESKARTLMDLSRRQRALTDVANDWALGLEAGNRPTFFAIRSADGSVLEQSHSRDPLNASASERSTNAPRFTNVTLPGGASGRQIEVDFELDGQAGRQAGEAARSATVIVAEPRTVLLWKILRASLTLLGFFALLLVALALLVRNALRRGLEPVVGLRRQLETLDPEHRGQRVNLQAPPEELAPIMRHINELLERSEMTLPSKRTAAR